MSLSCYDKMMIEDDNKDVTPCFKRMKLTSGSNSLNEIKYESNIEPIERLKKIYPFIPEEVLFNIKLENL